MNECPFYFGVITNDNGDIQCRVCTRWRGWWPRQHGCASGGIVEKVRLCPVIVSCAERLELVVPKKPEELPDFLKKLAIILKSKD